jgi:FkbM family methyltransferase
MTTCAIDVGAHRGEVMLPYAFAHPATPVYAFEPDPRAWRFVYGAAPNYHLIPAAVGDVEGWAWLYLNRVPGCSSLHRLDLDGLTRWPEGFNFAEVGRVLTQVLRLDTFMAQVGIDRVALLKLDAQAHGLHVLRGLGDRLESVERITIEVNVSEAHTYQDEYGPRDVCELLEPAGFKMTDYDSQTAGYEENWTFERL